MRTTIPSTVLGLVLLHAPVAFAQETTRFDVDPDHSTVQFEVDHLSLSRGYGRFNKVGGYVIEAADPAQMQVVIEIDPSSIDSGFKKRDDHLKSPDFLNVKQFRELSFKSKKVEKLDQNKFRVTGDMKMHGVTKEIAVVAEKVGQGKDPWGGTRSGYKARWDLKRSDYGMNFLLEGGALGDKIDVVVLLETIKKK